jgi:hypothetical protein
MVAAFWLALGASAVFFALFASFCLFGAILVVRPTPSVSVRAVVIGVACAGIGFFFGWASTHLAWYFAALACGSTAFAAVYLFALAATLPEFERRDLSTVAKSAIIWCVWVVAIALLWSSRLPGITETKDLWTRLTDGSASK